MSSKTKQYVNFSPEAAVSDSVDSESIKTAIQESDVGEFVNVFSVEFSQSETGNPKQSVVVVYRIDKNLFEEDSEQDYNDLVDVITKSIITAIGSGAGYSGTQVEGWS